MIYKKMRTLEKINPNKPVVISQNWSDKPGKVGGIN
jgi:hypothetical protein